MSTNSDNLESPLILYATETGTAQDVADQLARQCRKITLQSRVKSMSDYPPTDLISESLVIFVISTTGSGTEPRAMSALWQLLLRSELPHDLFDHLSFAVFGLGDTSYEKFCWPAKKLSRRLKTLGASEICERGEGDEQHRLGIDGALFSWMETLKSTLSSLYSLPPVQNDADDQTLQARVILHSVGHDHTIHDLSSPDPLEARPGHHTALVVRNDRITAEGWYQVVRALEFEFEEDIRYAPGDVAIIHPIASFVEIQNFLTTMNWTNVADEEFTIEHVLKDQSLPTDLPKVASLRTLFTYYLDINAVPRRSFFQYLRHFTTDDLEREKLDEFLSVEGADELYEYCHRVRRTIYEVLQEFRHVRIPKEFVFDVFPPLRPREFSIASSITDKPRTVELCVAIVNYRTKLKIPRKGVCTTYLASFKPGDRLRMRLQKGLIALPSDGDTPIICVGPGTGIAPMRAVLHERISKGFLNNTLYFGCRSAAKDHHYGKEWEAMAERGELVYRVAFSREPPVHAEESSKKKVDVAKKTYVQDLMREDASRVWDLIDKKGAWVFISGSANKMPQGVRQALAFAAETHGEMSSEEGREYVEMLYREGRVIEECWS